MFLQSNRKWSLYLHQLLSLALKSRHLFFINPRLSLLSHFQNRLLKFLKLLALAQYPQWELGSFLSEKPRSCFWKLGWYLYGRNQTIVSSSQCFGSIQSQATPPLLWTLLLETLALVLSVIKLRFSYSTILRAAEVN